MIAISALLCALVATGYASPTVYPRQATNPFVFTNSNGLNFTQMNGSLPNVTIFATGKCMLAGSETSHLLIYFRWNNCWIRKRRRTDDRLLGRCGWNSDTHQRCPRDPEHLKRCRNSVFQRCKRRCDLRSAPHHLQANQSIRLR